MDYPVLNKAPNTAEAAAVGWLDASGNFVPAAAATPLPVALQEAVAALTWTRTVVTLSGASQTLLAANTLRKGIIVANPVGNAQVSYDLAGGTATLANGLPLLGGDRDVFTGADCPANLVTGIGTNTQTVVVYEGT